MSRLTNRDQHWWIFTWGKWHKNFCLLWIAGERESDKNTNRIWIAGFGCILQILMPPIIPPRRKKVMAESWDAETVKRLGRNWYYDVAEREFGFSLSDMGNGYDFLQIKYGAQTHSSSDTMSWCCSFPWKMWRCVRHSIYNPDGTLFFTEGAKKNWEEFFAAKEKCQKAKFLFKDYDGEEIIATCMIEEREWHRGEGCFKWLKYFFKPMIRRSLDLQFNKEVGLGKGSWKGGTLGHGIDMLHKDESPRSAFIRYCHMNHDHKGRKFQLTYIGEV